MIVAARLAGAWAAWSIGDHGTAVVDFRWVEASLLSTPEEVREAQAGRSLCRLALGYPALPSAVPEGERHGLEWVVNGLAFVRAGDSLAAVCALLRAFPPAEDEVPGVPQGMTLPFAQAHASLWWATAVERDDTPDIRRDAALRGLKFLEEAGAAGVAEAALARRLRAIAGQVVPPCEDKPRCFAEVLATIEEALAAYRAAPGPDGSAFKEAGDRLHKALRPAVVEGQPWSVDLVHLAVEAAWMAVQWEEDTDVHQPLASSFLMFARRAIRLFPPEILFQSKPLNHPLQADLGRLTLAEALRHRRQGDARDALRAALSARSLLAVLVKARPEEIATPEAADFVEACLLAEALEVDLGGDPARPDPTDGFLTSATVIAGAGVRVCLAAAARPETERRVRRRAEDAADQWIPAPWEVRRHQRMVAAASNPQAPV